MIVPVSDVDALERNTPVQLLFAFHGPRTIASRRWLKRIESELTTTGQSTFPELRRLGTRFGDLPLLEEVVAGQLAQITSAKPVIHPELVGTRDFSSVPLSRNKAALSRKLGAHNFNVQKVGPASARPTFKKGLQWPVTVA